MVNRVEGLKFLVRVLPRSVGERKFVAWKLPGCIPKTPVARLHDPTSCDNRPHDFPLALDAIFVYYFIYWNNFTPRLSRTWSDVLEAIALEMADENLVAS
jgi:hypothetical protein